MSSQIEKIGKTKELMKVLDTLGFSEDLERSHSPRTIKPKRRSQKRYFRRSVLIVAKDSKSVEKAGRNIPGVDVLEVDRLRIEKLAPGGKPRLAIWSEAALESLKEGIAKSTRNYKQVAA